MAGLLTSCRRGRCFAARHLVAVRVCLIGAVFALLAQGAGAQVQAAIHTPARSALAARFSLAAGSQAIPRSAFGLSVEYNEFATYEREGAIFDRVIKLIRPQDGSRMLLRLGGKSADRTYYQARPLKPAPFSHPVGPQWLQALSSTVASNRLRVMLDLNLVVHSPALAVGFAQAARQALPRGSLAGLEIGNEPDLYWRQTWLDKERVATTIPGTPLDWSRAYSASAYRRDYIAYAQALLKGVPDIPIGGPEIISAKPQWLSAIEGLGPDDPSFLTIHRYASSNCWPTTSPNYPTIPLLLSEDSAAGFASTTSGAAAFAHSRRQALRLTEVNSISCGGNPGVADSFAAALWAPDALLELIRAGADSVTWHIRPDPGSLNAPFLPQGSGIRVMPELYGLAVFADMTGPGARILNSRLSSAAGLHLKAWAVRFGGKLRVLLTNKGPRASNVALHLGPAGLAYVRRLSAPAVGSKTGVTFGGQSIGSTGQWEGQRVQTVVHGSGGVYRVELPGYSAALVGAR